MCTVGGHAKLWACCGTPPWRFLRAQREPRSGSAIPRGARPQDLEAPAVAGTRALTLAACPQRPVSMHRADPQNVVGPHAGAWPSLEEEGTSGSCYNVQAPEGVVLSEMSRTHKGEPCATPRRRSLEEPEPQRRQAGRWEPGLGAGGVFHGESVWEDGNSGDDRGEGCTTA